MFVETQGNVSKIYSFCRVYTISTLRPNCGKTPFNDFSTLPLLNILPQYFVTLSNTKLLHQIAILSFDAIDPYIYIYILKKPWSGANLPICAVIKTHMTNNDVKLRKKFNKNPEFNIVNI